MKKTGPIRRIDGDPAPSRRMLLGVAAAGAGTLALQSSALVGAAARSADDARFMAASRLLIQHQLSPTVGGRLRTLLARAIPTLDADVVRIVAVAHARGATTVEAFFDALPEGTVHDTAHRIVFAWYAGVIDDSPTAELVAFEQALMYQPTRDAVAIPTYGFDGPDRWTDIDPPLSAMPSF